MFQSGSRRRPAAHDAHHGPLAGAAEPPPPVSADPAASRPGEPQTGASGTAQPRADREEHLLAVELNGEKVSEGALVLREPDGALYVPEKEAENWRLLLAGAKTLSHEGQDYLLLANPGIIEARIDEARQTLVLKVEPSLLAGTVVEASSRLARPKPERSSFACFLNYGSISRPPPRRPGDRPGASA